MDNTDLFDSYLSETMTEADRHLFEKRLKEDESFRKDYHMHVSIIKELNKKANEEDVLFYNAMKRISRTDLEKLIGYSEKSFMNSNHIKLYWISSIAAIMILGFFAFQNIQNNYEKRIDDMLVEYNIETVSRGSNEYLNNIAEDIVAGNNLDLKIQQLEKIYKTGNLQERPIAGWYLVMAFIKQHNHDLATSTLNSLIQQYPEFTNSMGADDLLKKIESN